jgi:pimeloyl-ACP methyl ester carboxylesterase
MLHDVSESSSADITVFAKAVRALQPALSRSMSNSVVQANETGTRMHWRESGSGEAVLFIHAFPFHSGMWEPQLERLPAGWRGIAPDLRGFGRSSGAPNGPYTMDLFADDMAALLNHLRVSKAVLCGCSLGGYVSFAFMRKYPDKVRALILCSTRSGADNQEGRQARLQLAARVRAEGVRAIAETTLPRMLSEETQVRRPDLMNTFQQMLNATSPETLARTLEGMAARPDSEETARNIEVPVLILHGTDDAIIPRGEAQMMARGIRGATIQLIPDAGHIPNLEQTEDFNRSLNDFLINLPPSYGTLKFA